MKEKLLHFTKDKKFWTYLIIACLCALVVCGLILGIKYVNRRQAEKVYDDLTNQFVSIRPSTGENGDEDNSSNSAEPGGALDIDFKELQKVNSDTYAWLEVPGTGISYPVVQHLEDASYYLNHTIDKRKGLPGTLFSEPYHSTTMYEPIHIIYGHNMKNKSMFGVLHDYEKEGYLEEHSYAYLYTPDKIYVYRIFAAVLASDEHFLNKFDFSTREGKSEYLNAIYNSSEKNEKNHYLNDFQVTT